MPHAVEISQAVRPTKSTRTKTPKSKPSSSRELRQLHSLYNSTRDYFLSSQLSSSIATLLTSKALPKVTKLVSLGLGTFQSKDQTRRLKQLVILLAISQTLSQKTLNLKIYAQDPSFSALDHTFLSSFGIEILSTPSGSQTGEAADVIDEQTLIYSPFLTLEAYQLFFGTGRMAFFIGDDFDALRGKWPKHSTSWKEVDALDKTYVKALRKKVVSNSGPGGEEWGFWEEGDKPFPMAMYWSPLHKPRDNKPKL